MACRGSLADLAASLRNRSFLKRLPWPRHAPAAAANDGGSHYARRLRLYWLAPPPPPSVILRAAGKALRAVPRHGTSALFFAPVFPPFSPPLDTFPHGPPC